MTWEPLNLPDPHPLPLQVMGALLSGIAKQMYELPFGYRWDDEITVRREPDKFVFTMTRRPVSILEPFKTFTLKDLDDAALFFDEQERTIRSKRPGPCDPRSTDGEGSRSG